MARGTLFREHDGWFVTVWPAVHGLELKTEISIRAKPMGVDPIFWDIVELEENNALPLSFRMSGAWTIRVPPFLDAWLTEEGSDAAELADNVLRVADAQFTQWKRAHTVDGLIEQIQRIHERDDRIPYLEAEVCTLALVGKRDAARARCESARQQDLSGGFNVGDRSFVDLALAWFDRQPRVLH